jgi:cyclohexa-1,5-dienecarbonyl-CoA hydratase
VSATLDRLAVGVSVLTFGGDKGNVLGSALMDALSACLETVAADPAAGALVITGAGTDFSYGASVEEHRVSQVAGMLPRFHRLLSQVLRLDVPVIAAVQGRCLGGGLELALCCGRVVAAPNASLGQPEVKLGVFAPAASALLPPRVGQSAAEDLLLTGRPVTGEEALRMGLVDEVAAAPLERALAYASGFGPLSRSAVRFATRAARSAHAQRVEEQISRLERLYLEELAGTPDAREGIDAFLARRAPRWADPGQVAG